MTTNETLTFAQTGPVTRIMLNRPDAANGIDATLARELVDAAADATSPRRRWCSSPARDGSSAPAAT
jgi:2-(1,2-epoxy-1,2-dihydrophenyl)acetyl-CoA isomerase